MIHHVGFVGFDASVFLDQLRTLGSLKKIADADITAWDCRCQLYCFNLDMTYIEVVTPRSGPLWHWANMGHQKTGLHHIALKVDDIEESCRCAALAGAELLVPTFEIGLMGWRVNFIKPQTSGVLTELVQTVW